jgi:hypothetical protein
MRDQGQILDSNNTLQLRDDVDIQQIISLKQFILLSILTFTLYDIWWIYKAWVFFQQKDKSGINPISRTFFSIFFLPVLFYRIQSFAKEKGYAESYSSLNLFIGLAICNILVRLPFVNGPFALVTLLGFLFLIPPFKAFNFARQNSPELRVNLQNKFNKKQKLLIIIGGVIWGLFILAVVLSLLTQALGID